MRFVIFMLALLLAGEVSANEYYYIVGNQQLADIRYPSPDAGCQAQYAFDQAVTFPARADGDEVEPLPYQPPYITQSFPPKVLTYQCNTSATITHRDENGETSSYVATDGASMSRQGNNCQDGQYYNPVTGICVTSNQEQTDKQFGNPVTLIGSVGCADPINIGTGNVFDEETDFADADGELLFRRTYNSLTGRWRNTYSARIAPDSSSLAMIAADDRLTSFALDHGIATAEPGEMGSMVNKSGVWTYTAPSNEVMTFGSLGRLTEWTRADGRKQTISYNDDGSTTVTDSQGHKLIFKADFSGQVSKLTVGTLTVSYQYDTSGRMTSVTRQWPDHTTTRTYLYEDAKNARMLTGIIDERGVRSATWAYDDKGRAISNERAGGAAKVTIAYPDDGSAIVRNVFGQKTVYRYDVVQGVKRVVAIEGSPAPGCPAANSSYTYTPLGQIATMTDALGQVTAYIYDDLGRETRRVEASGSPDERVISTTWDGTHFRPATLTNADRTTTYVYDDMGRLLSTSIRSIKE
jgi:YD repeat-containing protein